MKKQKKRKCYKKTPFNPRNSNKNITERNNQTPNTCLRYGTKDHFITNFPKPYTLDKKVHWNTENPKICVY